MVLGPFGPSFKYKIFPLWNSEFIPSFKMPTLWSYSKNLVQTSYESDDQRAIHIK